MPTRAFIGLRNFKITIHVLRRFLQNIINGPKRLIKTNELTNAPIIAEHRSSLWQDGRDDEFILRAGKVQNLRLAVQSFNGVVLPAGETLSFWAQLGRMSKIRGFAVGREIISGCIVPTIGGGICQLSNALAQVAFDAGIELTEWHHHSAHIEKGRIPTIDATVAWNYVDLRLCSPFTVRFEVMLSPNELIVRLRSNDAPAKSANVIPIINQHQSTNNNLPTARCCVSCEQYACFLHQPKDRYAQERRAIVLGKFIPELQNWLEENFNNDQTANDWFLGFERAKRRRWMPPNDVQVKWLIMPTLKRMMRSFFYRITGRGNLGEGGFLQRNLQLYAKELASAVTCNLHVKHLNLVLTQDLLVPLWRSGTLAGRYFDVWIDALPVVEIQSRLDEAAKDNPAHLSLRDFRADNSFMDDERYALFGANKIITAHAEVARVLQNWGLKVEKRNWQSPLLPIKNNITHKNHLTFLFPASALARKGAQAVAEVARKFNAKVIILGTNPSVKDADIWRNVKWQKAYYSDQTIWNKIDLVILPAIIEHNPRILLQALSMKFPVIATPACGIEDQENLYLVKAGDLDELIATTNKVLSEFKIHADLSI